MRAVTPVVPPTLQLVFLDHVRWLRCRRKPVCWGRLYAQVGLAFALLEYLCVVTPSVPYLAVHAALPMLTTQVLPQHSR